MAVKFPGRKKIGLVIPKIPIPGNTQVFQDRIEYYRLRLLTRGRLVGRARARPPAGAPRGGYRPLVGGAVQLDVDRTGRRACVATGVEILCRYCKAAHTDA